MTYRATLCQTQRTPSFFQQGLRVDLLGHVNLHDLLLETACTRPVTNWPRDLFSGTRSFHCLLILVGPFLSPGLRLQAFTSKAHQPSAQRTNSQLHILHCQIAGTGGRRAVWNEYPRMRPTQPGHDIFQPIQMMSMLAVFLGKMAQHANFHAGSQRIRTPH